jgi:hypothetical protein
LIQLPTDPVKWNGPVIGPGQATLTGVTQGSPYRSNHSSQCSNPNNSLK